MKLRPLNLLLTILGAISPLDAQGTSSDLSPKTEEEAPEALFQTERNNEEVELFFTGSWLARLQGGLAGGFTEPGWNPTVGPQDITPGLVFTQIPDFTLSLWFMKRYYTEVNFSGDFEKRTFLVGYQGKKEEFLQFVKLGNAPMSIGTFADQKISLGTSGAGSLAFGFSTAMTQHEFIARFEQSSLETKTFRGRQAQTATRISLDSWVRGRFFQLPAGVSGIVLWVQDPGGSFVFQGQRFRSPRPDEAGIEEYKGQIRLAPGPEKTVLVQWSALGSPQVLTSPGVPGPYELKNAYPLPDSWNAAQGTLKFSLVKKGSSDPVSGLSLNFLSRPNEGVFFVEAPGESDPQKPFNTWFPGLYSGTLEFLNQELLLEILSPEGDYVLGTGVVPGSVSVKINGKSTLQFDFEVTTGKVILRSPVFPTDEIRIEFQREKGFLSADQLFVAMGHRFKLSDSQVLEWAGSLKWNTKPGNFTTAPDQASGFIQLAGLWKTSSTDLETQIKIQGSLKAQDTTGIRRTLGMEEESQIARLTSSTLRPSPVPRNDAGQFSGLGLSEANRGILRYRDLFSRDSFGNLTLGFFSSGSPAPGAYTSGGNTGPYLSAGDSDFPQRALVMDYELSSSDQWVGAQVFPQDGAWADWRTTGSLKLTYKISNFPVGSQLFLQIGTLSEDFDSTGTLQATPSWDLIPSLKFQDSARGYTLKFPLPENSIWGNDGGQKRWLWKDEEPSRVLGLTLPAPTPGVWTTQTITLTPDQRARLEKVNAYRIIYYNNSGSPQAGTLLVGGLERWGTSFISQDPGASIRQVPENSGLSIPTKALGDQYPEIRQTYQTLSTKNQVLELRWPGAGTWTFQSFFSPVSVGAYRNLVFYYRLPGDLNAADATGLFEVLDAQGKGLHWTLPLNRTNQWNKAQIDLETWKTTVEGVEVGTLQRDGDFSDLIQIRCSLTPSSAGTFYFDELGFFSSRLEPLGQFSSSLVWNPHWILGPDANPWFHWKNVKSLATGDTGGAGRWEVQAQSNLLGIALEPQGELLLSPRSTEIWGGYTARWENSGFFLEEKFHNRGTRQDTLGFKLPDWGHLTLLADLDFSDSLTQKTQFQWQTLQQNLLISSQWFQTRRDKIYKHESSVWIESLKFQNPFSEEGLVQRSQDTLLTWKLPLGFLAWEAQFKSNFSKSLGLSSPFLGSASWSWAFPLLNSNSDAWTFTPRVTREVKIQSPSPGLLSWGDDWWTHWNHLVSLGPYLGGWPGKELTGVHALQGTDFDWGQTISTAEIDLLRPRWLHQTEFLLPRSFFIQGKMNQTKNFGSLTQTPEVLIRLSTQADNLWGAQGLNPLAGYFMDSFSRNILWSWQSPPTGIQESFSWDENLKFLFNPTDYFSLNSQLAFQRSPLQEILTWNITPRFEWTIPWDAGIDWPRYLKPKDSISTYTQTILSEIQFQRGNPGPFLRKVLLSYQGLLTLSPQKTFRAYLKVGQEWTQIAYSLGLEAGLELLFKF